MLNAFDFYVVELRAARKRELRPVLENNPELTRKIYTATVGVRYGYPVREYRVPVGYVDAPTRGAEERVEALKARYRDIEGVRVIDRYVARD